MDSGVSAVRAFLSHASEDKEDFVEPLARELAEMGVAPWLDIWEIRPGDSLVRKLFEEGLDTVDAVIVVVSASSAAKPWVREELDAAVVRRITSSVRLIPVRLDGASVPAPIQHLAWITADRTPEGIRKAAREITDAVYARDRRPAVAPPPAYTTAAAIPGLTQSDSALLAILIEEAPRNLSQGDAVAPELIDSDPPAWMLAALAERTGTSLAQLHAMTLAGWVPWLMDTLHMQPWEAQETFDTYIRQNSVLLAAGEAGHHRVTGRKRWAGPWWPARPVRRVCLACAEDADPRRALAWELPLTASCHEHGCRLEDSREVAVAAAHGEKPQPVPVSAALATLDRYTYEALITGRVTQPGRAVHAGVWFRMLRSLLDEVSLAGSTVSVHGRAALERAWQATGRPARGGLSIWRPYEQMDWPMQEAMLHAAAAVLQLAADGQITARGVLGPAVQPAPHRHVYDGDRPSSPCPSAWDELMAAVSEAVALARTDRNAARQLLVLLAIGCRTLSRFEEERSYLSGIGIPAGFLPSARELGRDDLA